MRRANQGNKEQDEEEASHAYLMAYGFVFRTGCGKEVSIGSF